MKSLTWGNSVHTSFISPDIRLLGYGGDDDIFTVVATTGCQVVECLICEAHLNTSFGGPDEKLPGCGGGRRWATPAEAVSTPPLSDPASSS